MRLDQPLADEVLQRMERRFQKVREVLIQRAKDDPSLRGMGTTMTVACTLGTQVLTAHVGDSRAYVFRRGGVIERLTRDQTLAQSLVDAGAITPEDIPTHPGRNVLTSALATRLAFAQVELKRAQIGDGDQLLLCSDGLTDMVSEEAIARELSAPGRLGGRLPAARRPGARGRREGQRHRRARPLPRTAGSPGHGRIPDPLIRCPSPKDFRGGGFDVASPPVPRRPAVPRSGPRASSLAAGRISALHDGLSRPRSSPRGARRSTRPSAPTRSPSSRELRIRRATRGSGRRTSSTTSAGSKRRTRTSSWTARRRRRRSSSRIATRSASRERVGCSRSRTPTKSRSSRASTRSSPRTSSPSTSRASI